MAERRGGACRPSAAFAAWALAAMASGSSGLRAQEPAAFRIQSFTGTLAGTFDGSWVGWAVTDPQKVTRWQEWLEVRAVGYVIHPKVLSFQVTARPLLAQGRYLPQIDTLNTSGAGNALTGAVHLDVFARSTLSGFANGRRTHGFRRTGVGGTQLQDTQEWEAGLRDNDPRMPARLSYASRHQRSDFNLGGAARQTFRDEWTRTLRYLAQSSKTRLYAEQRDYRRGSEYLRLVAGGRPVQTSGEDLHFIQRQAQATHQLRWGKGSRLFSRLDYIERAEALAFRSMSWSESATLRQSRTITSGISGTWTRQSSPAGRGSAIQGRYLLTFQPGQTFRLDLDMDTRSTRSGPVSRRSSGIGPRTQATLPLPGGARFIARGNASYRWNAQAAGEGLFAEAVQESHRPNAAGVFVLDNPFVDLASIVVFSEGGDQVFEEGIDFRVVPSEPFAEVHLLPGSRIPEDATVLVDYRFEVVPRASGRGLLLGYDLSLSAGPLALGVRRVKQEDLGRLADLPPGLVRFLGDEDRSEMSLTLSQGVGPILGMLSLHRGQYHSQTFDSRSSSANARISVVVLRTVRMTSSATYQDVTGVASGYLIRRADQSLNWQLTPFVAITGTASYWQWTQSGRDERMRAASAAIGLGRYRRRITFRYDYGDWRNGENRTEHRLSIGLSQRF